MLRSDPLRSTLRMAINDEALVQMRKKMPETPTTTTTMKMCQSITAMKNRRKTLTALLTFSLSSARMAA